MKYNELIAKLKCIKNKKEQIEWLFQQLLTNCQYDYLYLEIEKIKRIAIQADINLNDLEVEETREETLKTLAEKTALSEDFVKYVRNREWETRSQGEKDLQFEQGILVKGVCNDYTNFINKVLTEVGIESKRCVGKTPLNHAWNIISIENNPLHYDITYAMYARDKKIDKSNPTDWLGITTEQLQRLQPERTILSLTREK